MMIIIALLCGTLFGAGLAVSGMTDPQKILAFLDVAGIARGTWDPTLGVVFAAALVPMFAAYALQRRRAAPVLAEAFAIPARRDIDAGLVLGSILFGVGWGLIGLCPGPAFAALPLAGGRLGSLLLFIAAMIAGVLLARVVRFSAMRSAAAGR